MGQHPSTKIASPKFENPGGFTETEKISKNNLESGTANAVIRHHATFSFPFASSFIKALNRDVYVPGFSSEMVCANQPTSLIKCIGRMTKQRQGIQSTKPNLAAVPEEPPNPLSFCEDIDSYHNIFTKLIATSDIVSVDLSCQIQMQNVRGYQNVLFFI